MLQSEAQLRGCCTAEKEQPQEAAGMQGTGIGARVPVTSAADDTDEPNGLPSGHAGRGSSSPDSDEATAAELMQYIQGRVHSRQEGGPAGAPQGRALVSACVSSALLLLVSVCDSVAASPC